MSVKEYSQGYLDVIQTVRNAELQGFNRGLPVFDHSVKRPPVPMLETDSWKDNLDTKLRDLTLMHMKPSPILDFCLTSLLRIFKFFSLS